MSITDEVETLRQQMVTQSHGLRAGLEQIESVIDAERHGALAHIRAVVTKLQISRAQIAAELETLRDTLVGAPVAVEPPEIEERYAPPRFIREAAE